MFRGSDPDSDYFRGSDSDSDYFRGSDPDLVKVQPAPQP